MSELYRDRTKAKCYENFRPDGVEMFRNLSLDSTDSPRKSLSLACAYYSLTTTGYPEFV